METNKVRARSQPPNIVPLSQSEIHIKKHLPRISIGASTYFRESSRLYRCTVHRVSREIP
jgi:hypothetical protein